MNILIIGHKDHGKDKVGALLAVELDTQYRSSSEFIAERVVFPKLAPLYGYPTWESCFADRNNHRKEWFDLIRAYNTPDGARLAKDILAEATIYVGMRNREEFEACREQKLFDVVLWVDALARREKESIESMELVEEDADFILDNNGTLDDLNYQIRYYADLFSPVNRERVAQAIL